MVVFAVRSLNKDSDVVLKSSSSCMRVNDTGLW